MLSLESLQIRRNHNWLKSLSFFFSPALRGLVALLSTPPLNDDRHCRISVRYSWLVPICWSVADRLYKIDPQAERDTMLSAVSICEQSDHLRRYVGDTHKDVIALINSDALLKRALFWNNVKAARLSSKHPVTSWFQATYSFSISFFGEEDTDAFFDSIRDEVLLEDKRVALSVLLWLHRNLKLSGEFLDRVKLSVNGIEVLEKDLADYLTPPPSSEEFVKSEQLHRDLERKRKRNQKKDKIAREKGIEVVRANADAIGDLEIAKDGKIWNRTWWLFNETRDNRSSGNRWSNGNWEKLVPTFGTKVAHNYRDFCKQFWRRYVPTLRSDSNVDSTRVPNALILGLSGIEIEAQERTDWAKSLTIEEAKLATKYALLELNSLPSWLDQLVEQFPEQVKTILIREIEWEFDAPERADSFHYVLSRLRWTSPHLGKMLRPDIIALIENFPSASVNTLSEALTVVLRDHADLPHSLIQAIKTNVAKSNSDSRKAFWISILLCVDAGKAISTFEDWIKVSHNKLEAEKRVSAVLNGILGDRHDAKSEHHRSILQAPILMRLIKLANDHVRAEDDIEHGGVFSPGPRDHAQRARQHLTELLYQIPGQATHAALLDLSLYHSSQFAKDRMLVLAEQRAEADLDNSRRQWQAVDVTNFAEEAERNPKSQADLFDLCMSRLDDLKLDIEEGDESEASLLRKIADEVELRRVIANRLKQSAAGKYTTGSEEELADETRTDIRIHNPTVEARLPVEIKISGRWSGLKLLERLKNQLVKQYMRDAKFGIFLLVNRGGKSERKRWRINEKLLNFQSLLVCLSDEARKVVKSTSRIEGLAVVGFDLMVRDQSALQNVVRRKAQRNKKIISKKRKVSGKKAARGQKKKAKLPRALKL